MIGHILISVVFYFVLLYLSINLMGFFVRGLFKNPQIEELKSNGSEFIKTEIEKHDRADTKINIIALILLIAYFYLLFHFWNLGVVLVVIAIMAGRFPDLLWEIKHGKKLTYEETKNLPHNTLFYITSFLPWVALPILFYSLYYL